MGYLNNSGLTRFWNAIKSKFIRTINGIGPDTNGNVSVDTCEFINGTQTAATGSFTGVSRDSSLYDGKHIIYRLPYAGSGNATLNLTLANGTTTGAKNVWRSPGTRLTTHYAAGNFLGMTYFQSDDSWHCDADVNTDNYAYGVRLYYTIYKVKTALYRYQIVLTRDEDTLLPVNAVSNDTGTSKQLTTDEFDPFGEIYWYWTTTIISAGSYAAGSALCSQYWLVDLRYSFNTGTTLTAYKDVYLVCEPRPNGKAVLAPNPISQTLPSSEDGYVYIRLGKAYDTYRITLDLHKPRYYYANGEIREWTNTPQVPSGGTANQVLKKLSADDYDYDWETLDIHNIPSGGSSGQVLTKNSATNYDASWKTPASTGLPTGGSIGQVLAKKTATNYDVEWISPPSGVKIYNITYNSSTHTFALPDTFANVRSQFLAGNFVILSNNGLMYYLSEASASVLVFTTAVSDDYFVYRLEWLSSDTAIGQGTELSLYNNYVPSGGTTGQFLVKKSNRNFDLQWVTVPNANGVSF